MKSFHRKLTVICSTIVLVAAVVCVQLSISQSNKKFDGVVESPSLGIVDFVEDYAHSKLGKVDSIRSVREIESPITGYGLNYQDMSQGKILFNGWIFDIGYGVEGGKPVPHDGRVYTHLDFPDIYLFEAVVEAGDAVNELEIGDEVWINSERYVVKDFIPEYFKLTSDGQSVVYYPDEYGKMNGWDYDVFFQTCISETYWPCPINIWLLDEVE